MKNFFKSMMAVALLVVTANFASAQCTSGSSFGSSSVPAVGGTNTISSCSWYGEYSTVSGAVAGQTIQFNINTGGYITVHAGSNTGPIIAQGSAPLTFSNTFTGTLFPTWSASSFDCSLNSSSCRVTTVAQLAGASGPCGNIQSVACGQSVSSVLTSSGSWNVTSCGWNTNGQERVYTFNAPTTGTYTFNFTASAGTFDFADFFYKSTAGGCSSTGWNCIGDIYNGSTFSVNVSLTAGSYYILVDKENWSTTATTTHNWSITCPVPACSDFNVTNSFSHTSSTLGALNDCALRGSEDRTYKWTVTTPGCYTIQTCGGASWDTYLYLTTSCCGGTTIAFNDDACGLQSQISNVNLAAGTYYITVEGFSTSSAGAYTLTANLTAPPTIGAISGPGSFCCNSNVSFSVPFQTGVTYTWSTSNGTIVSGQGTSSVTIAWGSGSGTVSVTGSNCGGTGNTSTTTATCTPAGANDNCANATVVSGNSFLGNNICASGTDITGCTFNDNRDVWYAWTAPYCGTVNINTCSPDRTFDTHLSLFSGCGGTELACNDDAGGTCGLGSSITANVQAGVTYLIRFAGYNGQTGTSTVNVNMTSPELTIACSGNTTVYYGYPAMACATISASATGGTGAVTITWSDGQSGNSISVCPMTTTTYTATATDALGCTAECQVTVCVVDVTCDERTNNGQGGSGQAGNSGQPRVVLCHIPPGNPGNQMTKCLPIDAVAAHLSHGDHLGPCGFVVQPCVAGGGTNKVAANLDMVTFQAAPNPFAGSTKLTFSSIRDEHATVEIFTLEGASVAVVFDGELNAGEAMTAEFKPVVAEGIYIARFSTEAGDVLTQRLVVVR